MAPSPLLYTLTAFICMAVSVMSSSSIERHRRELKPVKFPVSRPLRYPSDDVGSPGPVFQNSHKGPVKREDVFVFPTDEPQRHSTHSSVHQRGAVSEIANNRYVPVVKRSVCSTTFCEETENYPRSYIENVLRNAADDFQSILGSDVINSSIIAQRIDATDENPLCVSTEQLVFPKSAKNKDDKWLFIVNSGEYTQGVRIETCLKQEDNKEQKCSFSDAFPIGYRAFCKQKYIYRKMLALDEGGKTVTDTFQLPSCCSCMVQRTSLSSRIGGSAPQKKAASRNNNSPGSTTPKSKANG